MTSYETARCVICYENKAQHFCIDCKSSSGVCDDCYNDWDNIQQVETISPYNEMPCPICKTPMEYALLNFMFKFEIECGNGLNIDSYYSYQKREKLEDIVYDAIALGKDKKKKKKKIYLISKK